MCVETVTLIDERQYERAIELFTEDALLVLSGTPHHGRAGILALLLARPTDVATRHLCVNHLFNTEADGSVIGRCTVAAFKARVAPGAAIDTAIGEYRDRYVRAQDGWRVAERRIRVVFAR